MVEHGQIQRVFSNPKRTRVKKRTTGRNRRERWMHMVKYAESAEDLLVAVLLLELCLETSSMKPR